MRNKVVYAVGRIASISSKPGLIFLANNYFISGCAELIAIGFLSSTLALILIATGSERRFYRSYLTSDTIKSGMSFYVYMVGTLILICLGFVVALSFSYYLTSLIIFSLLSGLYFTSEKIADEVLRFYLFNKDFYTWGIDNIKRALLQILLLAPVYMVDANEYSQAGFLLFFMSGINFLVFKEKLRNKKFFSNILFSIKKIKNLVRRSIRSLYIDNSVWIVSILGSLIGYIDRLIVAFMDKSLLPVFTMAVMCFSCMQMAIDFIYLSANRVEFLRGELTIKKSILSPTFLKSLSIGFLLSTLGVIFASNNVKGWDLLSQYDLILLFLIQLFLGLTVIPKEMIYWSSKIQSIIKIDVFFWFCSAIFFLAYRWFFGFSALTAMLSILCSCLFIRFTLYLFATSARGLIYKF